MRGRAANGETPFQFHLVKITLCSKGRSNRGFYSGGEGGRMTAIIGRQTSMDEGTYTTDRQYIQQRIRRQTGPFIDKLIGHHPSMTGKLSLGFQGGVMPDECSS
jgi:hypothetical protein